MHCDDPLPDQCIVFDREFDKAPFYLRVKIPGGIDQVALSDASGPVRSLPAAISASVREGFAPTHWMSYPGGGLTTIAPATVERLAAEFARSRG